MTHPKVFIYDTTLRDGTQGEGISFSSKDKIRVAEKLDEFGADYIEGGWPGSNPKDVEFFQLASQKEWKHAKIAAFGSTRRANTPVEEDPQIQTLLDANTPVVTYFGKSWKLHVTEVLKTTVEENQAMIRDTARHLKENGKEVVYDAEHFFDGYLDDREHAMDTLKAAKEGGADILVLCDTNGGTLPSQVAEITKDVVDTLEMAVGIHTHDDSGLGVANALSAVESGATQVQGTINGYGERTGNCNLTSVMPNLQLKMGREVVSNLDNLTRLAHFIDELANQSPNPRAPFIGCTAFAHKGGMHVNAVQKLARSYEHIEPESVGNHQVILVSELSGQSNVLLKAEEYGLGLKKGDPQALEILKTTKELENEGYEYENADASFELLMRRTLGLDQTFFTLREYHSTFRTNTYKGYEVCEATVKIEVDGKKIYMVSEGDGPVDALDSALRKALLPSFPELDQVHLTDYRVRIIDGKNATAAKTRVLIDLSDGTSEWTTVGVSTNIIGASWEALVDGYEYFLSKR